MGSVPKAVWWLAVPGGASEEPEVCAAAAPAGNSRHRQKRVP